ncbi:hypothetical protein HJC23_000286 [Cyclotella cryptica]|uniref:Pterin-binding domain-containing protein n=1 Tax=Cyclotella cryptica TaxID=29204 RepID=A0ABD3QCZ4_9STRA|eukprot:CCRYP_006861-RA/>CCRYP_006861-RA protein AED:0.02 eAED:0.02 QI:155/1/1/1/1/1/2/302/585
MKSSRNALSSSRVLYYILVAMNMMAVRSCARGAVVFVNAHHPKVRRGVFGLLPFRVNHLSAKVSADQSYGAPRNKIDRSLLQIRGGSSSSNPPHSMQPTWRKAYLGVGSNLGNQFENIVNALSQLQSSGDVRLLRTSFLRKTAPMYVTDQPDFLNGAVEVETMLTPLQLLHALKNVEGNLGRDLSGNATRFGPRPVDLDILLFDGFEVQNQDGTAADTISDNNLLPSALTMQTDELEIPHPRMAEREFVLAPLNDMDSEIVHPLLNKTLWDLLSSLRCKSSIGYKRQDVEKATRVLPLPHGGRMLVFNETIIMGILNVTPDSFSDGGKFSDSVESAALQAMQLEKDGARIIDVGGESTRPGAEEVSVDEELRRVLPVIARIREGSDVAISIDTRHSRVAKAAIEAGADIVNDVSGGTHDPNMLSCVASMGVPIILMHMRGNPKTMQAMTNYSENNGVVAGVAHELMERSAAAEAAGIHRWLQVLDPGIGFAKTTDGNLSLLKGADALRKTCDDLPFLFGPSRKGFIGKITDEDDPNERDFGTIAACLAALHSNRDDKDSCTILRVHNVKALKQAILVFDAIRNAQ